MTSIVYSVKAYDKNRWLIEETWWLSPIEASRHASRVKSYVMTLYELNEPLNPVALLSRQNFCKRFEIIEDTTMKSAEFEVHAVLPNMRRLGSAHLSNSE